MEARDKWQKASHNKVMPPTDRVVRQLGEPAWNHAPPQVFGKQNLPGAPPRQNVVVWNKHACDRDQDGTLDEVSLFGATAAGAQASVDETQRATTAVAMRRSTEGPGVSQASTVEEEAAQVANQRALLSNILSRNQNQLERLPKNPGGRDAAAGYALDSAWKECDDGPDGTLSHFNPNATLTENVDAAMATAMDEKTYQGNFPLYVRDLYLAENKAQLTSSSQMKRILVPSAAPGPLAGMKQPLTPPPRRFEGKPYEAARAVGLGGAPQGRPSTAPVGFNFTGTRAAPAGWDDDSFFTTSNNNGSNNNNNNNSSANASASRDDTGSRSPAFTSAYRIASFYESDHAEAYEGQWQHSKTMAPTVRGVRQRGEVGPGAGGGRRAGVSREGRATVTRHAGPSRPQTTAGASMRSTAGGDGALSTMQGNSTGSVTGAPAPRGSWVGPQVKRQLPAVLLDYGTQEGGRAPFYEGRVYNRDLATARRSVQSATAWKDLARGHESKAWVRSPNTGLHGSVYAATIPRSVGDN